MVMFWKVTCALAMSGFTLVRGVPLQVTHKPSMDSTTPTPAPGTSIDQASLDMNKICQDNDKTTVYEKALQMCISCFSCDPESKDDHCVTCRDLGIIPGKPWRKEHSKPTTSPGPVTLTVAYGGADGDDTDGHGGSDTDIDAGGTLQDVNIGSTVPPQGPPQSDLENPQAQNGSPGLGVPLITAIVVVVVAIPSCMLGAFVFQRRHAPFQRLPVQETNPPDPTTPFTCTSGDLTGFIPPNHEFSESEASL
ncbi:uncharacterized protein LOC110980910 [Acanthaster planci]|uniref:Uncharacterized protein LOC110980910 n=1 Tax=Acanthaster planci TaxID=133434 RepID=A0A8B7YK78_ACAPL|nr:uncharacterized protein LOC110980910 [Acanthaster planci]